MTERLEGKEPDPLAPAVRGFLDGREVPYANLAEIRTSMEGDAYLLVQAISARRGYDFFASRVRDSEESAREVALELVGRQHPVQEGLVELMAEIFEVLAPHDSPFNEFDLRIVEVIAARVEKSMFATAFKRDRCEGLAPAQQEKNRRHAACMALEAQGRGNPGRPVDEDLPQIVEQVFDVLIPRTVEMQQEMFASTYLLPVGATSEILA